MADNFDMKKFLVENNLGAYSKLKKEDLADAEAEREMDFLDEEETNKEESNPTFIEWLNAFKEEYSNFDELEKYGLDKATTPKEFYNIVKEKGKKYYDAYIIGRDITANASTDYKGNPSYYITLGPGMSAYAYWINDEKNKVIPKGEDNSKNIYPPGSRMDENFNLVTAFKSSPNKAPYEDVESIIDSIDNPEILNAFKEMFNGKESVSKQEYVAFLKNYPRDISADEVMAYWESLFDKDTFTKAGLAERKQKLKETVDKNTLSKVEQVLDMISNLKSNTSTNSNIPRTDKQGLVYAFQEIEDILEDVAADIEQEDEYVSDYSRRRASELNEASNPLLPQVEKVISSLETLYRNTSTNSGISTISKEGLLRAFDELTDMLEIIAANMEQEDEYVSELNEAAHKEGDALVTRFIKGIAKKYGYSEKDAVYFIKERLKHLGY